MDGFGLLWLVLLVAVGGFSWFHVLVTTKMYSHVGPSLHFIDSEGECPGYPPVEGGQGFIMTGAFSKIASNQ